VKVFDKKLLMNVGVFGPRREEVTGDWRKFHHEELHVFTPNEILRVGSSPGRRVEGGRGGSRVLHGRGERCIQNLSEKT
jgi:hypothetical protein